MDQKTDVLDKSIELIDLDNRNGLAAQNTQNPKMSLGRILKDICVECISETSLMGIPNVVKENLHKVVRSIWLVAFLAFFGTCIWNLVTSIQSYTSWPTYWDIKYIQEIPTDFPAVTICNRKLLDTSKASTKTWMATKIPSIPGPDYSILYKNYYEYNWFAYTNIRNSILQDSTLNSTTRQALGKLKKKIKFSN
jgi:hypothetical protein